MTLTSLELENQIGIVPWQNNWQKDFLKLNAVPTHYLTDWCISKGMLAPKALSLSREQLEKCYCVKNYFGVVIGNLPAKNKKFDVGAKLNQAAENHPVFDPFENLAEKLKNNKPQATTIPTDPVKQLIVTVGQKIDQKLKTEITRLDENFRQILDNEIININSKLRDDIEHGRIQTQLPKSLEQQIQVLVQKSAHETVLQVIKNLRRLNDEREPELELEKEKITLEPNSKRVPTLDPDFYFDPFATRVIQKALASGRHLLASGPAGCGKTTHMEQVAALMNHGVLRINPHDGLTRSFLLGEVKLKSSERGSETYFQDGALPVAMKEGLALIVDEFSFLPPNLAAVFHPVMEKSGKLYIPETGETISSSPGFCVLATDNTGGKGDSTGQFVGTEVQNTATLDRFAYKLQMDYLPPDKEKEMILKKFPNYLIPKEEGEGDSDEVKELISMISLAHEIRNAFARGELAITLSTRGLIDYFEHREQGFSLTEALNLRLLSWLDDDDRLLVKTYLDRLQIQMKD